MRKREIKRKKSKAAGVIAIIIAIACGIAALFQLSKEQQSNDENKVIYDTIRSKVHKKIPDNKGQGKSKSDTIDWEALKGYPVVGWIRMGEQIDYPILQGEDNKYYLNHAYDGSYNANGSIFMNCNNNADFMDYNTIVYGHNMRNKSMFGSIKDMLLKSENNPTKFYIYLPDGTKHTYDIYSINKVKDLGYAYRTSFGSLSAYDAYKDQMKETSEYDFSVTKTQKRTVMLSTCNSYGSAYGNRVVVLGQESACEQVQQAASWYQNNNYIEVSNKKAEVVSGEDYYYVIQDSLAIRCVDLETVYNLLPEQDDPAYVRVEYETTEDYLNYSDTEGNVVTYPIIDIIDYKAE